MKKYFCLFMVTMLTMSLTACGEKSTENTSAQESVEYTGEGEVQGGIPTDEELAAREEEAESYEETSEESSEINYSDANVEMETTPTASDTYISADNFWQGEDYFDLEEYLYMNGADKIIYLDEKADVIDRPTGAMMTCRTNIGHWRLTVSSSTTLFLYFEGRASDPSAQPKHSYVPVISSMGEMASEGSHKVFVDQYDNFCFEAPIISLDHLMWLIKQYPDDENPFQYADENIISMCITNY